MIDPLNNETLTITVALPNNGKTATVTTIGEVSAEVLWQLSMCKFKTFVYCSLKRILRNEIIRT